MIPKEKSEEQMIYDHWMHKLSPYQVVVLLILLRHSTKLNPMSLGEIEKKTSYCFSALKTNMKKLIEMGLVAKAHDQLHLYTTGNLYCE